MELESEFNCNKLLCDNQDSVLKKNEEPIASLNFLLKWSPKDYYLNFEELKVSEGYKDVKEIEMDELQDESNINLIKEQLHVRDNLIHILHQYFEKIFNISQQSQIQLKELNKKKKELVKTIRQLRLRKTSKKLEKKDTVSYEDKNIQTEVEEYDWNLYYAQYYNQFYTGENRDENSEMNTENISIAVPETESFSNGIKGSNTVLSDKNEIDIENSKEVCPKIVNYDLNEENITDTPDLNWKTVDVKEEVRELATEITEKLGYVFVKELDMYYDHSSGYYYDHKTSLYYDGKTGTYFYYDYEKAKYEFYAQVSPLAAEDESSSTHPLKSDNGTPTKEKEEGECSDSEEYVDTEIDETGEQNIYNEDNIEIAPSLRLMVMNGVKKGCLHVVTVDGGTIGREGDLQVLIKNPSVSKVHAEITYKCQGPFDHHYYLQDLGSINGTFIRGQRLSETREVSDIFEIGHGWEIKVGDVILCCHIHPGLLTCNECEPGLITISDDENKIDEGANCEGSKEKLEKERRRQNKVIRKKFSINYFDPGPNLNNSKYKDRAGKRRETVGSDNPYEKTQVASIDTNLTRENKGFQLMEKMGWSEGQTLGVNDSGLTEPVVPACQSGRSGFGSHSYPIDVDVNVHSSRSIKQRIIAHSKMVNSASSEPPPQTLEKSTGIQPMQFTPSSDTNNVP
ncbi:UNVERIFIED_CONTAM: hypothetical protein RMT77_017058 [Armadillidium vulgare]